MKSSIVSGTSGVAFAVVGWALPLVVPKVPPWIANSSLAIAVILLIVCAVLSWRGRKDSGEKMISQTGSGSAAFTGLISAPIHIGDNHHHAEPAWGGIPWPVTSSRRAIVRDISVSNAIAAIYLGKWSALDADFWINADEGQLEEAIRQFEQEARDGNVSVWGRDAPKAKGANDWHTTQEPIDPEYWRKHWVDTGSLGAEPKSAQRQPYRADNHRYYDLMTCKWQVQRAIGLSKSR